MYGNTVNFSHTSWIDFYFKNTLKNAIETHGGEKTPNLSYPLSYTFTQSINLFTLLDVDYKPIPRQTPLTIPKGNSITSRSFTQARHKVPIGLQWDAPHSSPKLPFLFSDLPHLIHLSLDWQHSPSQMASKSNQPFLHNIHPPHRPTDRQNKQMV